MGFKKFDGSTWQSITPKKLKGIPYTGTLPATLTGTKAGYLHRYKIYGNMVQTGTPTPENPIEPSECGERTANLWNTANETTNRYIYDNGTLLENSNYAVTDYIGLTPNTDYSISPTVDSSTIACLALYDDNKDLTRTFRCSDSNSTFTTDSSEVYIRCSYKKASIHDVMFNSGSSVLPYEPHGYKLPLTSAGQSVDIYLGESQTTRRIKKLVLTGGSDENWSYQSAYTRFVLNLQDAMFLGIRLTSMSCTHYIVIDDGRSIDNIPNNAVYIGGSAALLVQLAIKTDSYTTIADFKTYLQQQYANGTPVTIWYILAEPQTDTLNEPLRKIGDYADTIDSTQTTAQIPTTANSTTISWAGSGLAPSEFDSIQEWVDIPTYTRVNGAWVADN